MNRTEFCFCGRLAVTTVPSLSESRCQDHAIAFWQDVLRVHRITRDRVETVPIEVKSWSRAKLTVEAVLQIRAAHAFGVNKTQLAKRHGVSRASIRQIVDRKSWKAVA